jgi:hypothetical protein
LFLSSLFSIVARLVGKTTREVGATKQMGFGKYLLHWLVGRKVEGWGKIITWYIGIPLVELIGIWVGR